MWLEYTGGFLVGSLVEAAATTETPNVCLTQAAAVGKSASLVYYYYDQYSNPAPGEDRDSVQLLYITFYTTELVQALNAGGCYEFNLTVQDLMEYILPAGQSSTDSSSTTSESSTDSTSTSSTSTSSSSTSTSSGEAETTATPGEEGAIEDESSDAPPFEENVLDPFGDDTDTSIMGIVAQYLVDTFEANLDLTEFEEHLVADRHMHAGVFAGKAVVEIYYLLANAVENATKSELDKVLDEVNSREQ